MHTRCTQCRGQRYATGLGGIRKKCYVCNGVGYIDMSEELDDDESYQLESCDVDDEQSETENAERTELEDIVVAPKKSRKRRGE